MNRVRTILVAVIVSAALLGVAARYEQLTVNELISGTVTVEGIVDADSVTVDANVDVAAAGTLGIGTNTATAVRIGSAVSTEITLVTDGTGDTEVVLPAGSIGNAEITDMSATKLIAATVASAVDGSAITNLVDACFPVTAAIASTKMSPAVVTSLGLADTALQDADCYGSADVAVGVIAASQTEATNVITMKDVGGTTLAGYALTRVWFSETAAGTVATGLTATLTTGTQVSEETVYGDYYYVTAAAGTYVVVFELDAAADMTNYINVSVGPRITSEAMVFTP